MSLADVSIRRPTFITCVVLVMLAVGYQAMKTLGVDLFPDVTFPVVTVTTPYPGAGPTEVETLVSKPVEDELSTLSGIKRITSVNLEGTSRVIAEFTLETDVKFAEQEVRDRVGSVKSKLPTDIKEPVIRRIDPSDQPVLIASLEANLPEGKLFDVADDLVRPRLESVNQVGLVDVLGGRKREIHVALDRDKLKARELSVTSIANRLALTGENVPAGKVDKGRQEIVFRTLGEFKDPQDISHVIANFYGSDVPVTIGQVGNVIDTLEDETSRTFVKGKKSVLLYCFRQSGSNTIAVVDGLRARIAKLNDELKNQEGAPKLTIVRDGSVWIHANVDDVKESILMGVILAVVVVFFFLANGRSTIITGLALPNSLIGAFILMAAAGFTINIMTLLALSLSVGLLVDDAIVVRENIFRHIEMGKDPKTAAREGTAEVRLAVIATTLTVIAVFGPIGFLKGVTGQFFKQFGLTICFAMAISLFDALTIAPMLSAYFAGASHGPKNAREVFRDLIANWTGIAAQISDEPCHPGVSGSLKGFRLKTTSIFVRAIGYMIAGIGAAWAFLTTPLLRGFSRFQDGLESGYAWLLKRVLKHPLLSLGVAFAIFMGSCSTLSRVPKTFLPPQDAGEFTVSFDLPPGTNLSQMHELSAKADELIRRNPEVELTALTVGSQDAEANKSQIYVKLVPAKARKLNTSQFKDKLRGQLAQTVSKGNPIVADYDPVGAGQRPFNLNLISFDQDQLQDFAAKVFARMKKDPALKDVDTNYRPGKPEFQIRLDRSRSRELGVSTGVLGAELRAQIEGVTPAKLREKGREYDVRVRLQDDQRDLKTGFDRTYVPNVNGNLVRLNTIAKPVQTTGLATINRQDRGRMIQISSDITPGAGMGDVIASLEKSFNDPKSDLHLPTGMRYAFVGQGENFAELAASVPVAMGFGVLFIFLVLASLYESFVTPFTIMLALPLALCGSFVALAITRQSMNIFSMIGIIMLLGISTKNSILLVDYAAQRIRAGKTRAEAILEAGRTRLRPILMTTMALIAGTTPIALGLNEASRQRTSMGIAIIGGLISSTLLTLVVVPAAFSYIDRFREFSRRWMSLLFAPKESRPSGASSTVEPAHPHADGRVARPEPMLDPS